MFYGWKLAGIGSIGNLMLQGGVLYVMNAFMEPLVATHGWSRAGLSFGMSIASLCGTLSMPLAIALTSHISIRLLMTLGALIGGFAFIGLGHVSQLWAFTALFATVWCCGQACGGVVANVLMGNWFQQFRGRALGIVNMGTSLSGAVLPFLALLLVDSFGVTTAYTLLGSLVLLLAPLSFIMVRDRPGDLGLLMDDLPGHASSARESAPKVPAVSFRDCITDRTAWIMGVAFGVGLLAAAGVVSQLKPRFVDVGMSSYVAMTCMCATAFFGAVGKYMWGWISDKTTPLKASKALFICNALSLSLILLPPSLPAVLLFIVAYGLCMGGIWTLFPAMVVYMYGIRRFPSAYKNLSLFMVLKAAGYSVVGLSFSLTGGYDAAYTLMVVLLGLSFLAVTRIREEEAAEFAPATV